ncbi:hypothetical protein MTsPCn9_22610 [Croceitalea sp. MTPC9]|uniref:Lipocalin-like domain-containing protein n=1 Tax=Croceitalea marina TaxID=1775166 RepID=A0ABW5MV00_9FLAO|nr:hypothetical protein MTsPCn6_23650 [Croceitalea sp. MTPC6]GMN17325.1 hypothetical protein MTsPCn9_22610 [Croceitalea sp. MTPC9]
MLKRANLLLPLILLILLACNNDDQGSQQVNLLFTEDNLIGDWKRIAEFRGQPNDSLGILYQRKICLPSSKVVVKTIFSDMNRARLPKKTSISGE